MSLFARIDRHIARRFSLYFVVSLISFCTLAHMSAAVSILKKSDTALTLSLSQINLLILCRLPAVMSDLLPFCILSSATACFLSSARNSEIIAMRSMGLSAWRILRPVLLITLLIALFQITFVDWVGTRTSRLSQQLTQKQREDKRPQPMTSVDSIEREISDGFSLSKQGIWLCEQNEDTHQSRIVHIQSLDTKHCLFHRLSFFVFDLHNAFLQRINAERGALDSRMWRLEDVTISNAHEPSRHTHIYWLPTRLTARSIRGHFSDPSLVPFFSLPRFIGLAKSAGIATREHEIRFYSLLLSPVLACLMAIVAAIFTLRLSFRCHCVVRNIGLVTVAGFFIFFFQLLFLTMSRSGMLPPAIGQPMPSLMFTLASLWALLHLEEG